MVNLQEKGYIKEHSFKIWPWYIIFVKNNPCDKTSVWKYWKTNKQMKKTQPNSHFFLRI